MKALLGIVSLIVVLAGSALGQVAPEYRMAVVVHGQALDVEASVESDARAMRLSGMRKELVEANRANRRDFLTRMRAGFEFEGTAAFYADDHLFWCSLPAPLVARNIKVLYARQWGDESATVEVGAPGLNVLIRPANHPLVASNLGDRLFLAGRLPQDARRSEAATVETWSRPDEELEVTRKDGTPVAGRLFLHPGRARSLVATYEASEGRIVVTRYKNAAAKARTETYTPTGKTVPVDTTIAVGDSVSDYRLGGEKQVVYDWTGKLPTLDELEAMRTGIGSESGRMRYTGLATGAAFIVVGVALFAIRRTRRLRAAPHPPDAG